MGSTEGRAPLERYLRLRYPVTILPEEEGGYFAEIPDLPGCMTQGETLDEVFAMIEDARRAWITASYEAGRAIPIPRAETGYSGRFIVRAPASLHRRLVDAADREGVSLKQYVVQLLAGRADLAEVLRRIDELGQAVGGDADEPKGSRHEQLTAWAASRSRRSRRAGSE